MTYESSDMKAGKALVGKRINRVLVSDGESQMVFETDSGDVIWDTDGDCCSETWFADLIGFDALKGALVQSVESVELPGVEDGRTRQDSDSFYGYKITTDKGICDVVYRNSSNGYYGGSSLLGHDRAPSLREISDDWRA